MRTKQLVSHAAVAGIAAAAAFGLGKFGPPTFGPHPTQAQAQAGFKSTELFNQTMSDVQGRQLIVRLTEREPGNGSPAHRHPGAHTVGYILEGTYQVKIDEGPVRTLRAGEVFYEPPNALHAVSRNPSANAPLKYLVIQVYDATRPATVPEPTR
jgi:quercetin dioxygenase-like cupin family protein